MKKAIFGLFTVAFISLIVFSCDKIEDPFPPNLDVDDEIWDDSSNSNPNNGVRYVLLEEFTGHTCTNCPDAAREIKRLRNIKYGEKFIPIAIHATEEFASPKDLTGAPEGSYQSDHRTDESLEYENEPSFGILKGLPRGMVSRRGEAVVKDRWVQECNKIYETDDSVSVADINIKTYFHNPTGTFKVEVQVEWIEEYAGDMNLQIQVAEDHLVDWQLDNGDHVEDYTHEHMFRGSVNTAWGTPLDAALAGSRTDTSFTRSIENYLGRVRDYDFNNYEKADYDDWLVIVFLYKRSPEFEVMQVNEAHLTSAN